MRRLKTLVVGGGIAGMSFSIAARRHGHDVDLVELDPRVVGVGIFLNGSTLYALENIGLADACVHEGFPADAILYLDGDGKRLDERPFPQVASVHLPRSAGIQRRKLAHILGAAATEAGANIALGLTIDALEEDDAGVVATMSDGTQKRYDLIVAADGIYSKVRQLVFGPELAPVHAGQGGWRFMTPRLPEVDRMVLYETGGVKAGLIPLDDDWMYALLTMRDPDREWIDEASGPARLYELLEPFKAPILQRLRELLRVADPAFVMWRPFETLLLEGSWSKGRVVFIGDAAHSMTPHLSSGGGMAIEDAVVLADCLSAADTVEQAFQIFYRQRIGRVSKIQGISWKICQEETSPAPSRDKIYALTNEGYQALGDPFMYSPEEHSEQVA